MLIVGSFGKDTISYTNAVGRKATSSVEDLAAGGSLARISQIEGQSPNFEIGESVLFGAGGSFEVAPKLPGGYAFLDEWPEVDEWGDPLVSSYQLQLGRSKRYTDFSASEKVIPGKTYQFEIVNTEMGATWTDQITFNSAGVASFSPGKKAEASVYGITLTANLRTGAFTATVKLRNEYPSSSGKRYTIAGFAILAGDTIGWGGILGGDAGFRVRER